MADQENEEHQPLPLRTSTTNPLLHSSTGGIRHTTKTPRGVYFAKSESSAPESDLWLTHIERVLHYHFSNRDLLEEALETPGSGVVCVGTTSRMCAEGNVGLARVGGSIVETVVEDACYVLGVHKKDIDPTLKKLSHVNTLDKLGRETGIEKFIRPKAPLRESQQKNPLKKMLASENKKKVVGQAVKAILGAVYYDGGFVEAKRVCLGLGIAPKGGREMDVAEA